MTFAVTSVGCFDVRAVDPGPPVLDDFEDGDLTAALSPNSSCQTSSPTGMLDCEVTEGFEPVGLSAVSIFDPRTPFSSTVGSSS